MSVIQRAFKSRKKKHIMFKPCETARVFTIPTGVDFSHTFLTGLLHRAYHMTPHAFAKTVIYVNTQRTARRLHDLFKQQGATLLPRLKVLSDLAQDALAPIDLPTPTHSLNRRLELARLIAALIKQEPGLAPQTSVFALAKSLAALMDEMQSEGVDFDQLTYLNIDQSSEHWQRSLKFLKIMATYWATDALKDTEARQRAVIEAYATHWKTHPPQHPVLLVGSTGSRSATALFMQAIAHLPQGAVVLPGYDPHLPKDVWEILARPETTEDHPQSMLARSAAKLDVDITALETWHDTPVFCKDRSRLISLALRPAPVTDQWLTEGPKIVPRISKATQHLTLISAASPKEEADTIAIRLRKAAEDHETAVLITPDRALARRVTVQLRRWNIIPDDSAGEPLRLTPIGVFLRLSAGVMGQTLTPAVLMALLKHPLTHKSKNRKTHLNFTRRLELAELDQDTPLMRGHTPYVDFDALEKWVTHQASDIQDWMRWIIQTLKPVLGMSPRSICDWAQNHETLAHLLFGGIEQETHELWEGQAELEAKAILDTLSSSSDTDTLWTASDYATLLDSLLASTNVRNPVLPHPNIAIWGTLEARTQGADLIILGGLNEGTWPQKPNVDPWLNRSMRKQLGLMRPDRKTGLSAHDFLQGITQKDVILSRAIRDGEAPTVAARWLTRLENFLNGLGETGEEAWQNMTDRGAYWIGFARQLDQPTYEMPKAKRPAPIPPGTAHPSRLSVTQIKTLIRNPYEIYARNILKLRPLKSYDQGPDPLSRGIVLHRIIETFNRATKTDITLFTPETFLKIAQDILETSVPWPSARRLWFGRLHRIADWFVKAEQERHSKGQIIAQEIKGARHMPDLNFTLSAKADRLDKDTNEEIIIYDYKSGAPPTPGEITYFDKQLQLEATIATAGGFEDLDPMVVSGLGYIGLKSPNDVRPVPITSDLVDQTWSELGQLLRYFRSHRIGYGARLKMQKDAEISDYDHLSRLGEWDVSDPFCPEAIA